jgi:predicted rRNA methylase YqxC with S4 and FtsJ domains
LPHIKRFIDDQGEVVVLVKPQFEATAEQKHQGIVKNERFRRAILKQFEEWVKQQFIIIAKADSLIPGAKGNIERFYRLRKRLAR